MTWKAKFVPQMWINDDAVSVDALGDTTWEIGDEIVALAKRSAIRGSDWDYIREDDNAPQWVQDYPGPFEVELVRPDGTAVTASDVERDGGL